MRWLLRGPLVRRHGAPQTLVETGGAAEPGLVHTHPAHRGSLDVNSHKHRGLNSTLIGMEIVRRGYRWGCLVNDHRKEKEGK